MVKFPPEWGASPVPTHAKNLGFIDLFIFWASLAVGLLVLLAGSLLAPGLGLIHALLVSLLGSVIGSVLLAGAGLFGSRYGVPTMVSLRAVLGRKGSYMPTLLNVIQLVGWTAFELMIMAQAVASLTGFSSVGAIIGWVALFAVFCAFLAIGGPLVVIRQWLEKIAIWLVLGSTIWITYQLFTDPRASAALLAPGDGSLPLLLALDIVIAMPISWWPLISDYNRFAAEERSGFLGTAAGYSLSNTWFYFLGAALVIVTGISDVISSMLVLTFGLLALMMILVDETDNAFADIYSAAVSLQNILPKTRQAIFIVSATVIGILLGIPLALSGTSVALQYESFLLLIGGLFVPLLGVVLSDYLLVRRRNYDLEEFYQKACNVKWISLASWIIGIVIYFLIARLYPYLGASLPAFFIAAAVHYVLTKMASAK
jgi:putative hydroxymethylpyrimidine transporter CytX